MPSKTPSPTPNSQNHSGDGASEKIELIELKDEPTLESTPIIELKDDGRARKHAWGEESGGFEIKPESPSPTPESKIRAQSARLAGLADSAKSSTSSNLASNTPDNTSSKSVASKAAGKIFGIFGKKSPPPKQAEHEKYILLFDLDGTLLDSIEGIYHSFTHACGVDFSPTLDEVRTLIGLPLSEMFMRVGFSAKEAQNRVILYKNNYRKIYLQKTKLLPNVIESLIMAKSFAHLGVVTTKTGLYSKHILQHFDILKFFQVVIGSEDVQHPKPHPEPIFKALSSLPITPKEKVYMLGDTIYDLEAASNAQINGIWVRSGYGKGLESSASASFDSVYEAVKLLRTQANKYDDNWHSL